MHAFVAAGGGFLLAVLWFDLMFDVQVRGEHRDAVAEEKLDSIAAYYRRVTTTAHPRGRLVGLVMLGTLVAIVLQLTIDDAPLWLGGVSFALAGAPIGLAAVRVFPSAVRLGSRDDDRATQSRLAHRIYRDHVFCLASIAALVALQLGFGGW